MDATDRMRLNRLEERVARLDRAQAAANGRGSFGTSTNAGGAVNTRTVQLGFAAELTSGWSDATAYSWKRLFLDTVASPIALTNPGIQPTGDKAYEVSGNQDLTAGTQVWIEPSPDGTGYLFTADNTSSFAVSSLSCTWLKDLNGLGCWKFYRGGGSGRCSCFETDDPADPNVGIRAVFDSGSSEWVGVGSWEPPYTGMLETCCGCGKISLNLQNVETTGPVLKLTKVHVECVHGSGSGTGAVYDLDLNEFTCGRLADGRRFIQFTGYGPESCDGDQGPCDNTFSILAVCEPTCQEAECGCPACGDARAPQAFTSILTGFPSTADNGAWVWTWDGVGCSWSADCKGGTSTLAYDAGDEKWRLSHGGGVFEKDVEFDDCSIGMTLSKVSGSGPSSVTLDALLGADAPGVLCCELPDTLFATSAFFGTTVTLTRTNPGMAPATWEQSSPSIAACAGPPGVFAVNQLVRDVGGTCRFNLSEPASCCGVSDGDVMPVSVSPVLIVFAGSGGGGVDCPATDTITITDVAP